MTHNTTEERFKEKFGVYIADDTMYFPTTPSPREILAQIEDEKKIVREETVSGVDEIGMVTNFIKAELSASATKIREEERVTENTSDGYHTFKELYEFRKLYNAAFFNELYTTDLLSGDNRYNVHKSKRHSDGEECFGGGWFIVMATLPTGQISNHYELRDWDMFDCAAREVSEKWDGHTPQDVINRLTAFLLPSEGESNKQ